MKNVRIFLFIFLVNSLFWSLSASTENSLNSKDFSMNIEVSAADSIPIVALPNAFIPNDNNELLQTFKPGSPSPEFFAEYKMIIYNRWGIQIFESSDPSMGWNGKYKGKLCPVETYIYIMTYKLYLPDGSTTKSLVLKGNVSLLE